MRTIYRLAFVVAIAIALLADQAIHRPAPNVRPIGTAFADFPFTAGSGLFGFSFTSTTGGTAICAAADTNCFANVPIDTAGAPLFVTGNAGLVTGAGGTFPATQSGTWNIATVTTLTGITNPVASTVADGSDVALGATADAACSTDNGTCSLVALTKRNNQLITSSTIAAGTAGTPSSQVLSVQGVTNGTPQTTQPATGAARMTSASVSFASSGDNTVVTRATGTIKVYRLLLACASSVVTTIKDGAGTSLTGAMTMTSMYLPAEGEPHFTTTGTNNFVINLGSAVQCSGRVYYLDN